MKKLNLISSGLTVLALGIVSAGSSWAATAACTNTTAFPTQSPAIGLTLNANNGTINGPSGGFTPGCSAVDYVFSGFSNSTSTGANAYAFTTATAGGGTATFGADPTLNGIYATAPHVSASAYGTGIEFGTTRTGDATNNWVENLTSAGNTSQGNSTTGSLTSSFTYSVAATNTIISYASLQMTSGTWVITNGSNPNSPASSGSITITVHVCPGISVFATGCAGEVTFTVNGASGAVTSGSATFAPTTLIAVQNVITFTGVAGEGAVTNGVSDLSLINFTDEFGTPEPSTFILFGAGLVGLGFVEYRRRKLQA